LTAALNHGAQERPHGASPDAMPAAQSTTIMPPWGKAIDWLCATFGFKDRLRAAGPGGSIAHAQLDIGEGPSCWAAKVRILLHIDAEMSAEPMPFYCERIVDSGSGWLITMEK